MKKNKKERINHEKNKKSRIKIIKNLDHFENESNKIDPKVKEVEDKDPLPLKI